jgi:hypothetical protein
MVADRYTGGHDFGGVVGIVYKRCAKCGMPLEHYEERGRKPCPGRSQRSQYEGPDFPSDDPLER